MVSVFFGKKILLFFGGKRMKLLLESWRKFITEDWRDTSWKDDGEEVTIGEVVDYLGDKTVDINVLELSQYINHSGYTVITDPERVATASLEYPIIIVKSAGQYKYILDGNHRFQKAKSFFLISKIKKMISKIKKMIFHFFDIKINIK